MLLLNTVVFLKFVSRDAQRYFETIDSATKFIFVIFAFISVFLFLQLLPNQDPDEIEYTVFILPSEDESELKSFLAANKVYFVEKKFLAQRIYFNGFRIFIKRKDKEIIDKLINNYRVSKLKR